MFDAIAPRYDLLNHVLSAGLDRRWRERAVDALAARAPERRVLDLCTGTADLAVATVAPRARTVRSSAWISPARCCGSGWRRSGTLGLARRIRLVRGDAARIPLGDASCDAATIAFGIRNVAEPAAGAGRARARAQAGGRLAILEFGQPRIPGIRTLLLPGISATCCRSSAVSSRNTRARIRTCPPRSARFRRRPSSVQMCETTGFTHVRAVPLTFGIVYLYVARKAGLEARNLDPVERPEPDAVNPKLERRALLPPRTLI